MSRSVEERNRRMLRARDAMDRTSQEPVEQPYGIDIGLRDPFGNHIRIVQRKVGA